MELLEEKQILHVFFPRLGGQMFHVPHCAHLSGLQAAIVALCCSSDCLSVTDIVCDG